MRRIPIFRQLNQDYCGPAILKMVLAAHGMHFSQHVLAKEAKTPRDSNHGTTIKNLIKILRSHELIVREGNHKTITQLKKALANNLIVIICYTEPIKEWGHYAIVKEIREGKIILIDPDAPKGNTSMLIEEFKRRWKDPLFTRSVRWAAFVEGQKAKKKQGSLS